MTPAVYVAIGSAVIALLSLSYTVYDKRRTLSKKLAWIILSDTSLMPYQWSGLDIYWQERRLTHARLVVLEISNSGRVELKGSDIEHPLTIHLPRAEILSVQITYIPRDTRHGTEVEPDWYNANTVQTPRKLLNPDDRLQFNFLLEGTIAGLELTMGAAGFKFTQDSAFTEQRSIFAEFAERYFGDLFGVVIAAAVAALFIYFLN